jgi:N-acetylmuramoyl-L-alanine amidase CwlA
MSKSPKLLGKNIPLVEAVHYGGKQRPTAIVLRTSWTTGDKRAANGIAQAWRNPYNKVESCHYVVDVAQTIRCVPDKVVAFHTTPNIKNAISINVCYDPPSAPEWQVVDRAAYLTARLCKLYHIPIRILDDREEERWMKHKWRSRGGIILKTAGEFPTDEFLVSVEIERKGF